MTKKEKARQTLAMKSVMAQVGLRKEQIEKVLRGLKDAVAAERPLKFKRGDLARISASLPTIGSRIILLRSTKGVRCYSTEGHQAMKDNIKTHKPWKSRKSVKAKELAPK